MKKSSVKVNCTQLISRGTTRFTWSNAPVNASPSLTRPGTMRLIRSNAKPNLLEIRIQETIIYRVLFFV
ncbi:unnamed protein product [Rhizophagus irregularis]|nr:unnamed protein product [Rhizophagus irregularis]